MAEASLLSRSRAFCSTKKHAIFLPCCRSSNWSKAAHIFHSHALFPLLRWLIVHKKLVYMKSNYNYRAFGVQNWSLLWTLNFKRRRFFNVHKEEVQNSLDFGWEILRIDEARRCRRCWRFPSCIKQPMSACQVWNEGKK